MELIGPLASELRLMSSVLCSPITDYWTAMTIDADLTLIMLLILFVMLVKTKIPAPAVFIGALAVALTLNLAPADELLKGFSNRAC